MVANVYTCLIHVYEKYKYCSFSLLNLLHRSCIFPQDDTQFRLYTSRRYSQWHITYNYYNIKYCDIINMRVLPF